MEISLQLAQTLVDKAIAKAAADFKRPICVAICDKYGFLLAFGRMDGAPVRSIALSQGKAYSAARMGVDTDVFLERLNRENIPASYFCDDKLTGLPGGVVLKDSKDELIGGAGISGLKPEEDLAIATMMVAEVKQLLK
ncbi:heme-binding protein [Anaerospora sp.]|uniref:GlcG/HbpS family heme-binding protein n=1 Tax=Anaerospora sp. TaxID=1960278 RepID=UPI00289E5688|nr:heme-binding protein [Anaerospora sp.]